MKVYTFPVRGTTEANMEQYINSFSGVMNYCNQIGELKIPIPARVPAWYQEGINKITTAKTNAGLWKSAVSKNLIQLPQNILYYRPIYQEKSGIIQNSLKRLADKPDDESVRQCALKNISELNGALTSQINSIDVNVKQIQTFEQNFRIDIGNMQEISEKALQDEQVAEKKIKEIKKKIIEIEALISQYDTWITVGEIALGGGLALIAIGISLTGIATTVLIWFGGITAVGGAIEVLVLEILKSIENSNLRKEKVNLNEEESAALSMQMVQSKLSKVLDSSKDLQLHMNGMKGLWIGMGDFAKDMRRMLEEEKATINREVLLRTAQNLKQADAAANDYYNLATQLKGIKFNYVNRQETISA